MKTQNELNQLKECWKNNPYWYICNTAGFEEHRDELQAFLLETLNYWLESKDPKAVFAVKYLSQYISECENLVIEAKNKAKRLLASSIYGSKNSDVINECVDLIVNAAAGLAFLKFAKTTFNQETGFC
ncbi:hypothetical protein [Zooshikella ganghwensis]|uniref:Uncharacterized protein n=1 Tax=Zooshikella ganghwensis TaxID=202772 RepID=A0A4P9VF64_9GAMM|nr:hypothetical protein [Zooshikella ganghwensis]RDH41715.1 hypothetical protein B9G39_27025 [Zooshikella ganghwensis]